MYTEDFIQNKYNGNVVYFKQNVMIECRQSIGALKIWVKKIVLQTGFTNKKVLWQVLFSTQKDIAHNFILFFKLKDWLKSSKSVVTIEKL